MVSIIIPYYHEPYLEKTIASLKENAVGEVEILAEEGSKGMRVAINEGLKKATGDFLMKCDAHCIFGKDYDKIFEILSPSGGLIKLSESRGRKLESMDDYFEMTVENSKD